MPRAATWLAVTLVAMPSCLCTEMHGTTTRPRDDEALGALIAALSDQQEERGEVQNVWSNERRLLDAVEGLPPGLPGDVLLGVGPEQMLTLAARLRPDEVYVVDIRRDNMLLHLLYRDTLAGASGRRDFVCRLLSRQCQGDAPTDDAARMVAAVQALPVDQRALASLVERSCAHASRVLGPARRPSDDERIARLAHALAFAQGTADDPGLGELLTLRDRAGRVASFLASDDDFTFVATAARLGKIVPFVGDLRGGRALDQLSQHLRRHGLRVRWVYTSNVEQTLDDPSDRARMLDALGRLPASPDAQHLGSCVGPSRGCDARLAPGQDSASFAGPLGPRPAQRR